MEYHNVLQASAKRNDKMRRLYLTGRYTLKELGALFKVSKQRTWQIVRRRNGS